VANNVFVIVRKEADKQHKKFLHTLPTPSQVQDTAEVINMWTSASTEAGEQYQEYTGQCHGSGG
jgi:hypothetical protein